MYKRKIEFILRQWKEQSKRKPLIIKGVRQCGKTFAVFGISPLWRENHPPAKPLPLQ